MKFLKYLVLIAGVFSIASASFARPGNRYDRDSERVVLRFGGEQFQGQNTIYLKQQIKQQTGMVLRNMDLEEVRIIAKSKQGRGKASLKVGQDVSRSKTIDGYPRAFRNNNPRSYDRFSISNPSYNSQGVWQIKLRGNIKIKRIVVIMKKSLASQRKMTIDFYGEQFKGQNTIFLKREIKQQFPRFNFRNKNLKKIVLFAKSKRGRGQASLKVGQDISRSETVYGTPREFQRAGGFERIVIENPSYDSTGVWQVKLRGNIKVQKVVLKFGR